jgi:hypothetical protein
MHSITRLIFITGVSLSLLFMAVVLLVHMQPYNDWELSAFLASSNNCATLCFMGIRPGVTGVNDAIKILQNNPWVLKIFLQTNDPLASQRIDWRWRAEAPPFLQSDRLRNGGTLIAKQGIVQNIEVITGIAFGKAWLHWGRPEQYTLLVQLGGPIGGPPPPRPLTYIYHDIIVVGWMDCPQFGQFWDAKIEMILGDSATWLQSAATYPFLPSDTPITRFVRDVKTTFCPA